MRGSSGVHHARAWDPSRIERVCANGRGAGINLGLRLGGRNDVGEAGDPAAYEHKSLAPLRVDQARRKMERLLEINPKGKEDPIIPPHCRSRRDRKTDRKGVLEG